MRYYKRQMKNGFEVSFSIRNLSYKNKSKKKWGATKKVGRLSERKRVVAGRGDGIFAIFPMSYIATIGRGSSSSSSTSMTKC